MPNERWTDIGNSEELKTKSLQEIVCGTTLIALTYKDRSFAAISGACTMSAVGFLNIRLPVVDGRPISSIVCRPGKSSAEAERILRIASPICEA